MTLYMDQICEHQRDLTNSASQRFLPEFRIENLISSFSFVEASIILIAIHIIALILICFKMFKSEF